ncbi:MAG TPA: NUDIX domain-containing protein, partial [Ilumatobacteraceae bacterium]|nr:NUDIX domain-containing protein [Ilumatobacteraceae bacterium]
MARWYAGGVVTDPRDEPVEHVDADDQVIEVVSRGRMRRENLRHRSVAVVVTNSRGELLVHRRADDKDVFAGWWDLAAGGVVGVGESYADAATRELAEELGVTVADPTFVTSGHHDDEHAREICHVFRVVHDGPFRFDDGEVTEARFVTPSELAALIASERFLPGSMRMIGPFIDGFRSVFDRIPSATVQRVEFTVEPFVEGNPGRHVTEPLEALRALGIEVDFGPFASSCITSSDRAG